MPPERSPRPSPASSYEAAASSEDDDISLPSSPLGLSPPPAMPPERSPPPSPASSGEVAASSEDDVLSLPSSPSPSPEASFESEASFSDGSVTGGAKEKKKPCTPKTRVWPTADEVALLEAFIENRQRHGRRPKPADLVAALRGRLRADAEQVARRLDCLRLRYRNSVRHLSRGVLPVTDDDMKVYRLSKLIWQGSQSQTGKRKPRGSHAHHERRGFGELAAMYPCLAETVEAIEARRPRSTAGWLKRAFERIGDEKATELEAKVQRQHLAELRVRTRLGDLRNEVCETMLELID